LTAASLLVTFSVPAAAPVQDASPVLVASFVRVASSALVVSFVRVASSALVVRVASPVQVASSVLVANDTWDPVSQSVKHDFCAAVAIRCTINWIGGW
jgi:hypothetical protein